MEQNKLIFLVSLPRSGSTLVQKILGAHTDIYTRSEPWLMLPPCSALEYGNIHAAYDSALAVKANRDFVTHLPAGEAHYWQSLRECYLGLYGDYVEQANKSCFLDKTPRYYLVMPQLQKVFPQARYIVLYRNPLAILTSMIERWVKNGDSNLAAYRVDLIEGIDRLVDLAVKPGIATTLKYENLLEQPEAEMQRVSDSLQLAFEPDMLNYAARADEQWQLGDRESIRAHNRADNTFQNKWIASLSDPDIWQVCNQYLQYLGKEKFQTLGYDYEATLDVLQKNQPQQRSNLDLFELLYGQQAWPGSGQYEGQDEGQNDNAAMPGKDAGTEQYKQQLSGLQNELRATKLQLSKLSRQQEKLKQDYLAIVNSAGIGRSFNILASCVKRILVALRLK